MIFVAKKEVSRGIIAQKNKNLRDNKVVWVQGHFTDLLGHLRSFTCPVEDFLNGKVWQHGMGFDGSSVRGFRAVDDSDMLAVPDPETLVVLPWGEPEQKTARVITDAYESSDFKPFEGDPRYISKKAMEAAQKMGYDKAWISPELEFYVFKSMNAAILENDIWSTDSQAGSGSIKVIPELLEHYSASDYFIKPKRGYFAAPPVDQTNEYRNEFASTLMKLGVPVKYHHHEGGSGQVEIEFKAVPSPVIAADFSMLYKFVSKAIAKKYGLLATYMPKPIFADSGSGMHAHMFLESKGKPVFYDKDDEYNLSQTARYFMGGILEHAEGMTAITNPTINSYRRLVPDSEAPVYITWSVRNRSSLIRIPAHIDNPSKINCEVRHPDPSANPYLTFAVLLQCGLDGIKKKIEPGPPINENIYQLSKERRRELNVKQLPSSLGDALSKLETDDVVRKSLGKHSFEQFLKLKWKEWNDYCVYVSPWEHYQYFDI